jgi:AcrR family transcriptional regulator
VQTQTEDRREEIIQALIASVTQEGSDGATIKKVAERAGVSTSLVFYYFKNKEDLLAQAWASALNHFGERLALGNQSGLPRLDELFRVCFYDRDKKAPPWSFWLDFWSQASHDLPLATYHSDTFARMRETHAQNLAAATGTDALREDVDPLLAADLVLAVLYGLAVETTLDSASISGERAYEIAKLVLRLMARSD